MAVEIIHVSDIHFGSGEGHGRINPDTGLNVRFEDFVASFAKVVDYAIDHKCDVVLFSGDAYRNASPEPVYQKMFARELKRLSDAMVKTILLVGNHDQILRSTASHSMSVFQSLEVPGVLTIDQPVSTVINTANGAFQLIGLPHITRHQLLTAEKYSSMPAAAVDRVLIDHIDVLLKQYYAELDPSLPTVVTAHMTVDRAIAGIEKELLIGYTLTFPADIFIDERIDYVALGHVHRHQIIRKDTPAIVYAGSLERVDFGEQDEDKGFVHVNLARRKTTYEFQSVSPRRFTTVEVDLTGADQVTDRLCERVAREVTEGCVLRVRYKIEHDQLPDLDEDKVRAVAASALSVRFQPEVIPPPHRARLPQLNETSVASPLVALETYLAEVAPDRKETLMRRAGELVDELRLGEPD